MTDENKDMKNYDDCGGFDRPGVDDFATYKDNVKKIRDDMKPLVNGEHKVVCPDCGHQIHAPEGSCSTCPHCGTSAGGCG